MRGRPRGGMSNIWDCGCSVRGRSRLIPIFCRTIREGCSGKFIVTRRIRCLIISCNTLCGCILRFLFKMPTASECACRKRERAWRRSKIFQMGHGSSCCVIRGVCRCSSVSGRSRFRADISCRGLSPWVGRILRMSRFGTRLIRRIRPTFRCDRNEKPPLSATRRSFRSRRSGGSPSGAKARRRVR
jgi:hypothetical protein